MDCKEKWPMNKSHVRVRLLQLAEIQAQVAELPTTVHFEGDWTIRLGYRQVTGFLADRWRERLHAMQWMKQRQQ